MIYTRPRGLQDGIITPPTDLMGAVTWIKWFAIGAGALLLYSAARRRAN